MNRNFITQAIADPSKNLLFFLAFGTFGLTVASDAFSDLVLNSLGTWIETHWKINKIAFRLGIFALIVLLLLLSIAAIDVSQWLAQRYAPNTVKPKPLKTTLEGLIVIVSKTPPGIKSAAQAAIEYHWIKGKGNLRHCWLICGGSDSLQTARQMLIALTGWSEFTNTNVFEFQYVDPDDSQRKLNVTLKTLKETDIDDPHATFSLVNQIYEQATGEDIEINNIIADYTGGTKSMTAGLILASAQPERRLQFMRPGGYQSDGRADTTVDSIATEVTISFQIKPVRAKT